MKDFTRPIGEKFDYNGVTLEVVKSKYDVCKGCYFYPADEKCYLHRDINITGRCSVLYRTDHENVKFKEVKEGEKKKDFTRPIGEKFDHHGVKLEVVKDNKHDLCKGCYFDTVVDKCLPERDIKVTGRCADPYRTDHENVIFKEVER